MLVKNPNSLSLFHIVIERNTFGFVPHMDKFLSDIDYKIFVIEQNNDKPFNRGWLLNVGYRHS